MKLFFKIPKIHGIFMYICPEITKTNNMENNNNESQNKIVLSHLQLYRTITPLDAISKYLILRLGARIHNLRSEGHNIVTHMEKSGKKRYAKYEYIKPKEEIN